VQERDVETFRDLFDSPMSERHLRAVASIFGKTVPASFELTEECPVLVSAH
jgi:hypothetical protein